MGAGQEERGVEFPAAGPATVEEGPWLLGLRLEGEGRGGEVKPNLGGTTQTVVCTATGAGSGNPLVPQFPQVPGEAFRYHYHMGNGNPESGTQGKLRHSNRGGAPPPKRHLIWGDLQETSTLRAAAAAAKGGEGALGSLCRGSCRELTPRNSPRGPSSSCHWTKLSLRGNMEPPSPRVPSPPP